MVTGTSSINREAQPTSKIEVPGKDFPGPREEETSKVNAPHLPYDAPTLGYFKLHTDARAPSFGTQGAACFDLHALIHHGTVTMFDPNNRKIDMNRHFTNDSPGITIAPGWTALIPTGLILDIPFGYCVKIYSRSSTPLKRGLMLANSVGIIDWDYTDELFLLFRNVGPHRYTIIFSGDKLAQGELCLKHPHHIEQHDARPKQKTDRTGGMGSTGN